MPRSAREERLRAACKRRNGWTDDRQLSLVLRMLYAPDAPIIEVRAGRRARVYVRGVLDSSPMYAVPRDEDAQALKGKGSR